VQSIVKSSSLWDHCHSDSGAPQTSSLGEASQGLVEGARHLPYLI
jgi:hypothetical protein